MNKFITSFLLVVSTFVVSQIELLDRIAIIVDDGVVMESQITDTIEDVEEGYLNQNIQIPPREILMDQVKEKLIIEELQLQLADRAGVKISDAELNSTISRLAANNQMSLEEFIAFIENNGDSYEAVRERMRKEMRIQRIQRGRVNQEIGITEKEFEAFLATDDSLAALYPELLVRQILVKDLNSANKVLNLIKEGSDFSEPALTKKSVGYITSPLESGSGFHILKLEDKRGEFFQYEDQWESRHILLVPSAIRNSEETEKQLNEIRQRIVDGEEFSSLAEEFSEDPGSAKQGGELGWIGLGVFTPTFEKTLLATEVGTMSEVFESEFGFHFLEVLGKRKHELTNKLIEDRAYGVLYARKFDEELENTLRAMRAEAFVEFKDLD